MNISILTDSDDVLAFRALAGPHSGTGRTPGEALDNVARRLAPDETNFIVVQGMGGDRFFTADQHRRLSELKQMFRDARDRGEALPADLQAELNALIELELNATIQRAEDLKRRSAS